MDFPQNWMDWTGLATKLVMDFRRKKFRIVPRVTFVTHMENQKQQNSSLATIKTAKENYKTGTREGTAEQPHGLSIFLIRLQLPQFSDNPRDNIR